MAIKPMKRSCPSVSSVKRWNASRQTRGARNGKSPSRISSNANAIHSDSPTSASRFAIVYFAGGFDPRPDPYCLKYWKNSELGSRISMSLLLRNVALYASRLR